MKDRNQVFSFFKYIERFQLTVKFSLIFILLTAVCGQNYIYAAEKQQIDFVRIGKIISYTPSAGAANFICLTAGTEQQKITIHISFPFQDVIRVRMQQGEELFANTGGESFDIVDNHVTYQLKTDSLRVLIQKQPWRLTVFRNNGDRVLSEYPSQSGWIKFDDGTMGLRVAATLDPNEGFFGFGEKFNGMNQRGRKVVMEISDAYVVNDARTYKAIPFFISSKRYGLLVNSGLPVVFHLGDLSEAFYSWEIPDAEIDFYIFANENPLKIIQQNTNITGRSPLIPQWSLEPWLSRRGMTGWDNTATAEADIDMILKDGYRLGVILWEGVRYQFQKEQVPEMHLLSDKWHALGLKQVFWSKAGHVSIKTETFKNADPEYFIRQADSTLCIGGLRGGHAYIDPTKTEAMSWWKKTFYEPYLIGDENPSGSIQGNLDGIKIDFCELFPKYRPPLLMKRQVKGIENLHATLFSEQIYNWLQEIKPEGGITWVRGGGLGSQRVGYVWGGDRRRTFQQFKGTVSASLSLAICGVALAGHDLGGYIGGNSPDARDVYIRGAQYAAFSPSFHDHGSAPAPWEQDEYGRENYKFYARLRYNLLPYLYHYVKVAHQTGLPLMRPLFLHYPDDEMTYPIEDEYMLGESMLVAPFVHVGTSRDIYLPRGEWIDFWTEITYSGGRTITYTAPLNRIPVLVKKSSIIPLALNDKLQIGGLFPQAQKNDLLLSFCIYGDTNAQLSFWDGKQQVDVTSRMNGDDLEITVENISRDFGVCVSGAQPESITVNQHDIKHLTASDFEVSNHGWTYDTSDPKVLIKITRDSTRTRYVVQINGLGGDEYTHKRKERFEQPGTPPSAPKILAVQSWDQTLDVYFQPVKNAFSYVVKYDHCPDALNKKIENVAESPVTIADLTNRKKYYVSIQAINEWGAGSESQPVSAKPTAKRKPVLKIENNEAFIKGNHYIAKSIDNDGIKELVYSVDVPDSSNYQLWIKARKNIPHHLYYRWYHWGAIMLKKGISTIQLTLQHRHTEIDKLYLTSLKGQRPLLKLEIESLFSDKQIDLSPDKKIVVRF